jgi:hypothetical protein
MLRAPPAPASQEDSNPQPLIRESVLFKVLWFRALGRVLGDTVTRNGNCALR